MVIAAERFCHLVTQYYATPAIAGSTGNAPICLRTRSRHWVRLIPYSLVGVIRSKQLKIRSFKINCQVRGDIIKSVKTSEIDGLLQKINILHPNLKFTIERSENRTNNGAITTGWYSKPTDTGTSLSFRASAPMTYKRNSISGHVRRLFNSSSTWQNFHVGIEKAQKIWSSYQYPSSFCNNILKETMQKLVTKPQNDAQTRESHNYAFVLI